jgi:hypothetical protein
LGLASMASWVRKTMNSGGVLAIVKALGEVLVVALGVVPLGGLG